MNHGLEPLRNPGGAEPENHDDDKAPVYTQVIEERYSRRNFPSWPEIISAASEKKSGSENNMSSRN